MKWLIAIVFSLLFIAQVAICFATGNVGLEWDANSEPDLAGYKIYYKIDSPGEPYDGVGATEGDSPIDVGNITTFTLNGLIEGSIYYFAATAYNTGNLESNYSNEVTTQIEPEIPPDTTPPDTPSNFVVTVVSVSSEDRYNIALNKQVTSSGNEYTPGTEIRIVDGIVDEVGEFWAARGVPNWIVIDLGNIHTIDGINVNPFGRASSNYWYAEAWNVKYAVEESPSIFLDFLNVVKVNGVAPLTEDGISVMNGDPVHGLADNGYQYYEFAFDPVDVRYVRIEVTKGDADGDSNLDEVEVFTIENKGNE